MQHNLKTKGRSMFSKEEDNKLKSLVSIFGEDNWSGISHLMEGRSLRQCKERWMYHLSPSIRHDEWTMEEDILLLNKYNEFGPRWKLINAFFNGRTDAMIKNRFNKIKRHEKKHLKLQEKKEIFQLLKESSNKQRDTKTIDTKEYEDELVSEKLDDRANNDDRIENDGFIDNEKRSNDKGEEMETNSGNNSANSFIDYEAEIEQIYMECFSENTY